MGYFQIYICPCTNETEEPPELNVPLTEDWLEKVKDAEDDL